MVYEINLLNDSTNREIYMNLLRKTTLIRDNMTLFLCVSVTHLSINYLSQGTDCLHHIYGVWFSPILALVCFMSITNNNTGVWALVFDVLGLTFGSFLQIVTKPDGWWAEASIVGCNIDDSPVALQYFFLGEIISFSVLIRFLLWTVGYWKGLARWCIILSTFLCTISFALALNSVTAKLE